MSFIANIYKGAVLFVVAGGAKKKGSLTDGGIATAFVVGLIHCLPDTTLYINILLFFFIVGNIATKYKLKEKETLTKSIEEEVENTKEKKSHSKRNHVQVLANSLPSTILLLINLFISSKLPEVSHMLLLGSVINYSVASSDTFSSEFGILSKSPPILLTTFKPCPKGTNGGVSAIGLAAAFFGSLLISIISAVGGAPLEPFEGSKLHCIGFVTFFGVVGSLVDSLLGATCQVSYVDKKDGLVIENHNGVRVDPEILLSHKEGFSNPANSLDLLDNNGVNVLSIAITVAMSVTTLLLCY